MHIAVPMDVDTTQKLSFQPNCPSAKETFPWAVPAPYRQPTVPMAHDTTYHLSFMGGSGKREPLQMPRTDPNMIVAACSPFDGRTVYKESYLGTEGGCRPPPILPTSHLLMSCADQVKMDTNTMYGLAYEGHYNVCKQQPIRPMEQPMVGSGGPMQDLTTQKHDFVWKPCAKRQPIMPHEHQQRPTAALDTTTTANASYMPITQFSPSVSCRPQAQYIRPCGMLNKMKLSCAILKPLNLTNLYNRAVLMDTDTTQKLSFQPVCVGPKEQYEWAQKPAYQQPMVPMSTETVHQLSYPAPGRYEDCCDPCQPEPTACC